MKALRTLLLDEVYELLTPCDGKVFTLGEDDKGAEVQAEMVLVRRNEGRLELRFRCTADIAGGTTETNIELELTVERP